MPEILQAELTWTGTRFESDIEVVVSDDGRIYAVRRANTKPSKRLDGQALMPGFINAHSHAFQRGLRGLGERYAEGPDSFWTWRETMYDFIAGLDENAFRELCYQCFEEMRDAGITTVGEFHYLHHSSHDADHQFDEAVLAAAAAAEIRLVLLSAYYATGGIGKPLEGSQCRFATHTPEAYWLQMDRLSAKLHHNTQRLGAVVHSIRAASLEDCSSIYHEARRRNLVFHMHVEEQRREIAESIRVYGKPPLELIHHVLQFHDGITAVHCTHSSQDLLRRFLQVGGLVCVCPLTEANLGDGIPDLADVPEVPGQLCLGTDSNARVSMWEEMRWVEYGQRLVREARGMLKRGSDVAQLLLEAATATGARSLGVSAGQIAPGCWADFMTIDLDHPSIRGCDPQHLLDALVFGAGNEVIVATSVGGRWRDSRAKAQDPTPK